MVSAGVVSQAQLTGQSAAFLSGHGALAPGLVGSLLAATGHKPQIENIRMAGGHIERQCQPCVSSDKLTREMYRMREEGCSMAEISDKLGFDKSTISRRLSALPYHLRRHCM